jgi:hypothetical protein
MKITLNENQRKEITALRKQLAAALGRQENSTAEMTRLTEKQERLQGEIAALEKGDLENDEAAASLAAKRIQLEQVAKKIAALDSVPATVLGSEYDATAGLLREFARTAAAATQPDIENYVRGIASKILPWCLNEAEAMAQARNLSASKSLVGTYTRRFGDYGLSVPELKAAVARADEILSGVLAWSFVPQK